MKIAIAINGEGRGHLSRARALAEKLGQRHDISFYAPRHFAPELTRDFPLATVNRIPYFRLEHSGFSVDYLETFRKNFRLFFRSGAYRAAIAARLAQDGIQAVISDFEPLTSAAAKTVGLPVLQLNHPGIICRVREISVQAILARIISRVMMAHSDQTVICSFFGGDVGPILREELRRQTVTDGAYLTVYLKDFYKHELEPILAELPPERYRKFPDPRADYAAALAGSAGLIAPAGHQSISEALVLGKPVFVIPVRGQHEQELNARRLRDSGFGDYGYIEEVSERLKDFLANIDRYRERIADAHLKPRKAAEAGWKCLDDTHRAVELVERFIALKGHRTDWKPEAATARYRESLGA